jgi:hypothetical protein
MICEHSNSQSSDTVGGVVGLNGPLGVYLIMICSGDPLSLGVGTNALCI